jgi:predicted ATP-grasp superfamily ATP-dependent carboligase
LVRVSENDSTPFDESEEIAYLHSTPVETILGNHLFVLLQVAALRLGDTPPDLAGAQLVIDIVSAMLNAARDRLGEHVELYRSALAEMQQAYVRAANAKAP